MPHPVRVVEYRAVGPVPTAKNMTRILAFTPYATWLQHSLYETTITRACQLRGAEVKHLLCDSQLPQCDIYGALIDGRNTEDGSLCGDCRNNAQSAFEGTGLTLEWMSSYLDPADRDEIAAWAKTVEPEELLEARFDGRPLGNWVASSVVSFFRVLPVDLSDARSVEVYRKFLQAGALTARALNRLFDGWRPDALVVFNTRMSVTRVAFKVARERGIRVLAHERPYSKDKIFVMDNNMCSSPKPFRDHWRLWKDVPLTRDEVRTAGAWIRNRRVGRGQAGLYTFSDEFKATPSVRKQLGLAESLKLVALYTSSVDEFYGEPEMVSCFDSQEEFIERTVAWAGSRPDVGLVIRAHPALAGKGGNNVAETQIDWFRKLGERVPGNVRIVMPTDSLSSYDLMDQADMGVVYASTTGLEMLALGKPVVTCPPISFYGEIESVCAVTEAGKFTEVLEYALSLKPDRRRQRDALRCVYRIMYHWPTPFAAVTMTALHVAHKNYRTTEDLRPGVYPGLDRICAFLIDGTPLQLAPTEQEREIDTADEDRYLGPSVSTRWVVPTAADRIATEGEKIRLGLIEKFQRSARGLPLPLAAGAMRIWHGLPPAFRKGFR